MTANYASMPGCPRQHRLTFHACLHTQFFRLYADRVPPNLFDRLRYIIQVGCRHCANWPGCKAHLLLFNAHACLPIPRSCLQGQDWDFIAHTFWLKHGVAMLFDSLYLAEGITLAYNSGEPGQGLSRMSHQRVACCSLSYMVDLWYG